MTTIKLFESWVKDHLAEINEDWSAPAMVGNNVVAAEYEKWITTGAAAKFLEFAELASDSNINSLSSDANYQDILFAMFRRGQKLKKGFAGIGKYDEDDLMKDWFKSGIKIGFEKKLIDYIPAPGNPAQMLTRGRTLNDYTFAVSPKFSKSMSNIQTVCDFVNYYNVAAFREDRGQFVLSLRLNKETGYMDLTTSPEEMQAPHSAAGGYDRLHLYAPQLSNQQIATKSVETEVAQTGGEAAVNGKFGAAFDAGSDAVNASVQAEVAKAIEVCLTQFPAGKRPDKFTLTSGASTEWNGKQMPVSNGIGAKTPTDDATKNQDLAYRRGVAFMNALNAGLKAKGHPGFDTYEIAWSIGKSGKPANPADRFVDLELQKNAVKPKAIEKTQMTSAITGDATQSGLAKGQIFELVLYKTYAKV